MIKLGRVDYNNSHFREWAEWCATDKTDTINEYKTMLNYLIYVYQRLLIAKIIGQVK